MSAARRRRWATILSQRPRRRVAPSAAPSAGGPQGFRCAPRADIRDAQFRQVQANDHLADVMPCAGRAGPRLQFASIRRRAVGSPHRGERLSSALASVARLGAAKPGGQSTTCGGEPGFAPLDPGYLISQTGRAEGRSCCSRPLIRKRRGRSLAACGACPRWPPSAAQCACADR